MTLLTASMRAAPVLPRASLLSKKPKNEMKSLSVILLLAQEIRVVVEVIHLEQMMVWMKQTKKADTAIIKTQRGVPTRLEAGHLARTIYKKTCYQLIGDLILQQADAVE